jgi:DNA sulfur modification protein DndD
MPNGTGKTTTLELLKKSLYNHEFKSDEVLSYSAKQKNEFKKEGYFQIKCEVEGKIFYSKINFNFENKTCSYESSTDDGGGWNSEFSLPSQLSRIINREIINLLFVDLEKDVKPMFRENQTGAQEAIKTFCKIDLIDRFITDLDSYKTKKRKENIQSGATQNQINTEEARETKIINQIEKISIKIDEFKKYLNKTEDEYNNGKEELRLKIEKNTDIKKKLDSLQKNKDEALANYEGSLSANFDAIKKIGTYESNLKEEIIDFVAGLDDMQLPEAEARVFFEALIKRESCVCGVHLDDDKRNNVRKEMESFISSDNADIISRIKNSINQNSKESSMNDLNNISRQIQEHKHNLDSYSEEIEYLKKSQLTKEDLVLNDKINNLEKIRKEKELFLKVTSKKPYTSKDDENSESMVSLEEQKKNVVKKLAKLSSTQAIEEKAQYLTKILEEAKKESEVEISNEITIECNKKLKEMSLNNPLFINSIKENIKLEGQSEGSTGQEARIGIIFLLTMLERSSIKFPLILDVPVKGMDFAARRRTAQFISKLESQFIGFVIDSDKEDFTDKFKEITQNANNFLTCYRREKESEEFDNLAEEFNSSPDKNSNAHVVYDYEFFRKFKKEGEENGAN